ncbi:MAG: DUF2490 domain-containing protein [Dysgonamonadaceae bacterium]|jgi:hypothetical protein|nr:DUF2490 domain-containing protein [Dysgonamonadaceae bacterium]
MTNKIKYAILLLLMALPLFAQPKKETNLGTSLSLNFEKKINRKLDLELGEEVRLINNNAGFDRCISIAGLDYFLLQEMKIGAYYSFIYQYNNDFLYEARHRFYVNISYKKTFEPFVFSWRGRFQTTYRDENRGEYRVNPKYAVKNKFEVAYLIWGSPWKPFLSCDFSTDLNDPETKGRISKIRCEGGVNWRYDRTTYFDFFLRFDSRTPLKNANVLSIGANYRKKF